MLNAADLPDDIAALKAMLLASEVRAAQSEARAAHLAAELSTRTAEIEHLKLVLAKLRRMQFGRKSEKLDQQIEQLELQLEDLEAEEAVAEAQVLRVEILMHAVTMERFFLARQRQVGASPYAGVTAADRVLPAVTVRDFSALATCYAGSTGRDRPEAIVDPRFETVV